MLFKNPVKKTEEDAEDVDENYDPQAEVVDWSGSKKLNLPEAPLKTGEEDEETVAKFRTKLYRWAQGEWKERGVGDLKFLQHKTNKKTRVLLRQDKTHKIVANFLVAGDKLCELSRMKTNEKTWIWDCVDYSDEEAKLEKQAGRLTSKEEFERFQQEFEKAYKTNTELIGKEKSEKKPEEAKAQEGEKTEKPAEKTETTEANKETAEKKPEEQKKEWVIIIWWWLNYYHFLKRKGSDDKQNKKPAKNNKYTRN